MYRHPEAVHAEQDRERAEQVACDLRRLRAEAARRVPGWSPELREENRRIVLGYCWAYRY